MASATAEAMGAALGAPASGRTGEDKESGSDSSDEITTGDGVDYMKGAQYWDSCEPTIDAMLGGFSKISGKDIAGSQEFLSELFMVCIFLNVKTSV